MERTNDEPRAAAARHNLVICFDGTNNKFGPENTSMQDGLLLEL